MPRITHLMPLDNTEGLQEYEGNSQVDVACYTTNGKRCATHSDCGKKKFHVVSPKLFYVLLSMGEVSLPCR
jgi:hypothetical protein